MRSTLVNFFLMLKNFGKFKSSLSRHKIEKSLRKNKKILSKKIIVFNFRK